MTYRCAAAATTDTSSTGRSSRYGLTPQARSATASRSPDIRPSPMSSPTSSAIGMVSPSACGMRVIIIRSATPQGTPLATSASSCSMNGGISRMKVKISSDRNSGGRISRIRYRSRVFTRGCQDSAFDRAAMRGVSTGRFCGPYGLVLIMDVMLTKGALRGVPTPEVRRPRSGDRGPTSARSGLRGPDASLTPGQPEAFRKRASGVGRRTSTASRAASLRAQVFDDGLQRFDHFLAIDARFGEAQLEPEGFGGGLVAERVVFGAAGFAPGLLVPADRLARGAAFPGDALDERHHFLMVSLPNYLQKQRLRGNVGQPTQVLHLVRHGVQRERLRDRRAGLPQLSRHVFVGVAAPRRQRLQRLGFFKRRQILPLDVLDERDFDDFVVVDFADDDRHFAQPDLDRRLIPALAGHDLKPAPALAADDRLDDPFLGTRPLQPRQIPRDLPAQVRCRIQLADGHEPADRRPRGTGQRLDVVLVVAHPHGGRQSSLRHGPSPPHTAGSTPPPPSNRART